MRERTQVKGFHSVRTHQPAEEKYVREMQPYECCHCPPEHEMERTGWWRVNREPRKPSVKTFHFNRNIGRFVAWMQVYTTACRLDKQCKHMTKTNLLMQAK